MNFSIRALEGEEDDIWYSFKGIGNVGAQMQNGKGNKPEIIGQLGGLLNEVSKNYP
jgi:hypothetical protein